MSDVAPYYKKTIPVYWLVLDSSSALFSLLMVFLMTMNRYVAVVKPFKYKSYFRRRNVFVMISIVATTTIIFLVVGAIYLAIPERVYPFKNYSFSRYRHDYYNVIPDNVFYFYTFIWPCAQLFIVAVDSIVMITVYIGVANSYELNIVSFFKGKRSQSHELQEVEGNTSKANHLKEYRGN